MTVAGSGRDGCSCWTYKYNYRHAPPLKKLVKTIEYFNLNSTRFNKSKPVSSIVQLLCILPKQSSNLVPSKYRSLMYNSYLFPDKFEIDVETLLKQTHTVYKRDWEKANKQGVKCNLKRAEKRASVKKT